MKIAITLKDPDGVYESIRDAANESVAGVSGLSGEEVEQLIEARREKIYDACAPWIEYGEYVTIEIDTEAGTAIVCKV